MRAFADITGTLSIVYRSAQGGDSRDIYLLASRDRAKSFDGVLMHRWKIAACPMSTVALAEGPNGVLSPSTSKRFFRTFGELPRAIAST